jgi:regulator of replication initiation timing
MANNERLTKRLKKIEEWVAENENMGGPKGYLDTMVSMYQGNVNASQQLRQLDQQFQQLKSYAFEFIQENKLDDKWNEFLKEKDNAVQEQQAEEVPLQEEAESGKEVVEAPKEEKTE